MKCGACGASFTKCGLHRFGCAAARDRATCTNSLTIHGGEIETTILAGLKQRLMEPALFEEFTPRPAPSPRRRKHCKSRWLRGEDLNL